MNFSFLKFASYVSLFLKAGAKVSIFFFLPNKFYFFFKFIFSCFLPMIFSLLSVNLLVNRGAKVSIFFNPQNKFYFFFQIYFSLHFR